jgi:predicted SAM-dependent methyltransferase
MRDLANSAAAERLLRLVLNKLTRGILFHWDKKHARRRFASRLTGRGVEVGALFAPMPVPAGVTVRYVDHKSAEDLRAEYPEYPTEQLRPTDIVDDASTLATLPDASEDFLIASHVYEHLRNPVQALETWCRVVKPGGLVYIVVPHKARTFDWPRTRTTLEHLVLDYERPSLDRDYEHFLDYAKRVHFARNPKDALEDADRLIARQASIHYHVFAPADFVPLLAWFSAHVRRIEVVDGPYAPWLADEFHVLIRPS